MARSMKPMVRDTEWFPVTFRNWMDNFWNVDKFFDDDFVKGTFMPAVNIRESEKTYDIEVAAPGMKKEDFEVKIENGMLCISAEHKEEKEEKNDNYTRREFAFESFKRSFLLPENVEESDIDAKYKDGVLHLTMKKNKVKPPEVKKIKVG